MTKLRWPFLILALILALVIVLVERSAVDQRAVAARLPAFITGRSSPNFDKALTVFTPEQQQRLNELRADKAAEIANLKGDFSSFGTRSLQYVDFILLFTLGLMAVGWVSAKLNLESILGRIQGVLTLIFAIVLILAAVVFILQVVAKLIVMVSLLLSFPFGTLAYLFIYGSFDRASGSAVLALIFMLKILLGGSLLLAQQRFIENLGLILFILAGFAANLIVSFLYALVPIILVSITDAIAAIVVAVVGGLLALVLGGISIGSIVLSLKPS